MNVPAAAPPAPEPDSEDIEAALDFVDGF